MIPRTRVRKPADPSGNGFGFRLPLNALRQLLGTGIGIGMGRNGTVTYVVVTSGCVVVRCVVVRCVVVRCVVLVVVVVVVVVVVP